MASPSITILGGGISGLSTAFHLARRFPLHSGTRIALVESSERLGGWMKSEKVVVKDSAGQEAGVVLESGPRTLRPASKAVLELVHLLGLKSSLLSVPRNAPAARNRFLHLSGRDGLVTIPSSPLALLRSPLAKILVPAVLKDARKSTSVVLNNSTPDDESVDAFFTRHFGAEFSRTFGSALVHGIYATDSRLLSIRSAFPVMCQLEESGNGSLVWGAVREALSSSRKSKAKAMEEVPYELGDIAELMRDISVFSFQDGMQTLSDSMTNYLERLAHIDIVKGDRVVALITDSGDGFETITASGKRLSSSHIVSAMPLPRLHRLLGAPSATHPSTEALPHLANPSSSVTVVNLAFPPTPRPIHPDGFGYLIPRPYTDYPASSLGMLGTVFDSCALPTQDRLLSSSSASISSSPSRFTKLTVMLGGPYGTPTPPPSSSAFLPTLLETLRRHLGRAEPLPEPCLVRIREHQDCIPTPTVGHTARVAELTAVVRERWGPNAAVIGAGVGGVSVGDCVESGRRAAYGLAV